VTGGGRSTEGAIRSESGQEVANEKRPSEQKAGAVLNAPGDKAGAVLQPLNIRSFLTAIVSCLFQRSFTANVSGLKRRLAHLVSELSYRSRRQSFFDDVDAIRYGLLDQYGLETRGSTTAIGALPERGCL
jgi:hypothetical protein